MSALIAPHPSFMPASYLPSPIPEYRENPYIEAVPTIMTTDQASSALAAFPEYNAGVIGEPAEVRLHMLGTANRVFVPLPHHLDLQIRLSRALRDSYVPRNPLARNYWPELHTKTGSIHLSTGIPYGCYQVPTFAVLGISGMGKTCMVGRNCELYPQVIQHTAYHGVPFHRLQVVYLILQCPYDGSVKQLCLIFFLELDKLLGTTYYVDLAQSGRAAVDSLVMSMATVAEIHGLGVLVIDEVQHLNQAQLGGCERIMNFFLQLTNTLRLPIIFVGTYAAKPVLTRELRQVRRCSGMGDMIIDRMRNDRTWRYFLDSLWRYQYIRKPTPLTDDIANALYDETQGIMDFTAKLPFLAQARAIVTGRERVDVPTIRSVAADSLRLARPILRALREGDTSVLASLNDIHPIDFDTALRDIQKERLLQELSGPRKSAGPETHDDSLTHQVVVSADVGTGAPDSRQAPASVGEPPKAEQPQAAASNCVLLQTAEAGQKEGLLPQEALIKAGFVRTADFAFRGTHAAA